MVENGALVYNSDGYSLPAARSDGTNAVRARHEPQRGARGNASCVCRQLCRLTVSMKDFEQ